MNDTNIKTGFVSIIGLPNAGKSTFLNKIISDNIAITSKKSQTTRKSLKGIYNDNESQIVFVDTPGIHNIKNKLDEYMSLSIKKSISDVEIVIVIVDVMTYEVDDYGKINNILSKVDNDVKIILIINKIDIYQKKEKIIGNIDVDLENVKSKIKDKFKNITFDKTFLISSLKDKNEDKIIKYLKQELPIGFRYYDSNDLTDMPIKEIVADMIRQSCLYKLSKEIPHGIAVIINSIKESNTKCMNIDATIICEKNSHKGIIIGKSGSMIKNIGTFARISIEKLLNNKVNLKLQVIVKENWREELTLVNNFGYNIKNL